MSDDWKADAAVAMAQPNYQLIAQLLGKSEFWVKTVIRGGNANQVSAPCGLDMAGVDVDWKETAAIIMAEPKFKRIAKLLEKSELWVQTVVMSNPNKMFSEERRVAMARKLMDANKRAETWEMRLFFSLTEEKLPELDSRVESAEPRVTWNELIGVDEVKAELVRMEQERFEKFVCIFGKWGMGKSVIAKAFAAEFDYELCDVRAMDLFEEEKIKALFQWIKSSNKRVVMLFHCMIDDPFVLPEEYKWLRDTLVKEFRAMDENDDIKVIVATHKYNEWDEETKDIFKVAYVDLPSSEGRIDLMKHFLSPKCDGFEKVDWVKIGSETEGMGIRHLKNASVEVHFLLWVAADEPPLIDEDHKLAVNTEVIVEAVNKIKGEQGYDR